MRRPKQPMSGRDFCHVMLFMQMAAVYIQVFPQPLPVLHAALMHVWLRALLDTERRESAYWITLVRSIIPVVKTADTRSRHPSHAGRARWPKKGHLLSFLCHFLLSLVGTCSISQTPEGDGLESWPPLLAAHEKRLTGPFREAGHVTGGGGPPGLSRAGGPFLGGGRAAAAAAAAPSGQKRRSSRRAHTLRLRGHDQTSKGIGTAT